MKNLYLPFVLIALLISFSTFSQEKFTLSGSITDNKSNETMIGVNIYIPETKSSTNTNQYGFYSITLPKGSYTVLISYVGFKEVSEKIDLTQNTKKEFQTI